MGGRRARDDEVARWREHGWILLEGLVPAEEIDAAAGDLYALFPTAEEYHADPEGETERRLGRPAPVDEFPWPAQGPGFRHDQHRWMGAFPFAGSGLLNRLVVHSSIVNFAVRRPGRRRCPPLSSAGVGQVHGYHQLRAAHAHRPEPFVAPPGGRGAMVARRGISLSFRRRTHLCPHPPGVRARVGGAEDDGTADDARQGPGAVCRRAGCRWCAGLVPRLPLRRLPPGCGPDRARRCPVPSQCELQARRPGLGGLPHHASRAPPRLTGWRSWRRRHRPSWRCSGSRLPGIRSGTPPSSTPHNACTEGSTRPRGDPCSRPEAGARSGPKACRDVPRHGFSAIRQERPLVLEPDNLSGEPWARDQGESEVS